MILQTNAGSKQTSHKVKVPNYSKVWFDSNGQALLAFGDGRAGNIHTPYNATWQQYYQFTVSNTNGSLSDSWKSFFAVVAQSNVLIYNVQNYAKPAVSDVAKKRAIGEARYMRGVAYSQKFHRK